MWNELYLYSVFSGSDEICSNVALYTLHWLLQTPLHGIVFMVVIAARK